MNKLLLMCLLLLTALVGKAQKENAEIIKVGDQMPAFTIVSDNGQTIKSADLKGKVVLITFFATWCPPCQKELPELEAKVWNKYKDNKNFRLLVVGREHDDAELAKYNEKKGFTFPLYPDKNRAVFASFAGNLIPRNYLIGKNGNVIYTSKGYSPEEFEQLLEALQKAL